MSFDLFKHDVKIQNQRIEEAEAKRHRKAELFKIAQMIFHNANQFAVTHGPFTDGSVGESEVNLFYETSHLKIEVLSEYRFVVKKTVANSTVSSGDPGKTVDKEDMKTCIVDFVRNRG